MGNRKKFNSLYPSTKNVSEFSIRSILLGIIVVGISVLIFSFIMAYVGLYAGVGVALFFPTIIFSTIIIRFFKGNAVEAHFAGVVTSATGDIVFAIVSTLPVLIILGISASINLFVMVPLYVFSGLIGVLFATILRRVIIDDTELKFPESVAVSGILSTVFHESIKNKSFFSTSLIWLIYGIISSAIICILMKILNLLNSVSFFIQNLSINGRTTYITGGIAYSPALIGVGWIIGPFITSIIFLGAIFSWFILNPAIGFLTGYSIPTTTSELTDSLALSNGNLDLGAQVWSSFEIWGNYTRFIAVGIILVALVYIVLKYFLKFFRYVPYNFNKKNFFLIEKNNRCDTDIPRFLILILSAISLLILFFLISYITNSFIYSFLIVIFIAIFGFIFVSITGYLTGIIGSSNTPITLISISLVAIFSFLLIWLGVNGIEGIGFLVISMILIVSISSIACSLFQNMATGRIIGANPFNIQIGTIIGLIIGVIPSVIMVYLLDKAYQIGSINLPAPHAFLVSGFIERVFSNFEIILPFIFLGIIIGVILCILDFIFKKPIVFAFAIGVYLPITISTTIFIGGIIRYLTKMVYSKRFIEKATISSDWKMSIKQTNLNSFDKAKQKALLFASGLIAGEAIVGVILALLIFYGII